MKCPYCGMSIEDGSRFCGECGARLEPQTDSRADFVYGTDTVPRLAPGYSRKLESEAVLAGLKKQRRATRIIGLIVTVLPLIGFGVYGAISDAMELWQALFAGVVISVIIGVTTLIVSLHKRLAKSFDGTLTRKKHVRRVRHSNDGYRDSRNDYILYITDENGKRHKKHTTPTMYNYLNEGDRLRYLPQFPIPFEKYDKSRDAEIPCLFCGRMNPAANDSCSSCRNPMIK